MSVPYLTQIVKMTKPLPLLVSTGYKMTACKISPKLHVLELSKNGPYSSGSKVVSWREESNYKDSNV